MNPLDGVLSQKINKTLGLCIVQLYLREKDIPSAESNMGPFKRHFFKAIALPLSYSALAQYKFIGHNFYLKRRLSKLQLLLR